MATTATPCTHITIDETGAEVAREEGTIYTPATVADLATLFGMTMEELAEEQERQEEKDCATCNGTGIAYEDALEVYRCPDCNAYGHN